MTGDCPMPECGRPLYCRGYCRRHYYRMVRTGSPLGRAGVLPIDRFNRLHQVDKATGCWLWVGGKANTRWYRGHRYCRQCKREAGRADRYPVADLVLLRRAEA